MILNLLMRPVLASAPTWPSNRLAKVGHARSQCKEALEVYVTLLLQTAFLSSSSGPRLYFNYGFRTVQAQNAEPGWEVWWEGRGGEGSRVVRSSPEGCFDLIQSRIRGWKGRGWEEQQRILEPPPQTQLQGL